MAEQVQICTTIGRDTGMTPSSYLVYVFKCDRCRCSVGCRCCTSDACTCQDDGPDPDYGF